jgi:hypothetical protein
MIPTTYVFRRAAADPDTGEVDPMGAYKAACRGLQAMGCVVGPYSPPHPTAARRGCAPLEPWPRMLTVMKALLTAIVRRADGRPGAMSDCSVSVAFRERLSRRDFETFYRGAFGSRPADVEPRRAEGSRPARSPVGATEAEREGEPEREGHRRGAALTWSRSPRPVSGLSNLSAEPGQSEPLETRVGAGATAPGADRVVGTGGG